MLICASCGSEEPEGSGFCGSCGAPLTAADAQPDHPESIEASPPSEVIAPEGTDAPTEVAPSRPLPQAPPSDPAPPPLAAAPSAHPTYQLPPELRRPSRKRWLIFGGAILASVSIAAAALLLFESPGATKPRTTGPPKLSLTSQIAERVSRIVPDQRSVDSQLAALSSATTSLAPLQGAGRNLQREILLAQGFSQRLAAGGRLEQVELTAFDSALREHATYASLLASLPRRSHDVSAAEGQALIKSAAQTEAAYTRLSGMASAIPLMRISREQTVPILNVVRKPIRVRPTTSPTSVSKPSHPATTSAQPQSPPAAVPGPSGRLYAITHDVVMQDGPSQASNALGFVAAGTLVGVECKVRGEIINGPWGADPNWDQITVNGVTGFVTDEWVNTKQDESDPTKVPLC
jgi:hypothetical protein